MKIKDFIIYAGAAALLATGVFSQRVLAGERNLIIKDSQNPSRIYTVIKKVNDSELGKTWVFKDPVTDAPLPGIEIYIDDIPYGTSDENGEILKPTGIEEIVNQQNIPRDHYLRQNYPNPFNPETTIEYGLNKKSNVKLEVYNILGQKVTTLLDKEQAPGIYTIIWDGKTDDNRELSSGLYFYRIIFDDDNQNKELTRKMILLK